MEQETSKIEIKKINAYALFFFIALVAKLAYWDLSISLFAININPAYIDIFCAGLLLLSLIVRRGYPIKLFAWMLIFIPLSILVYLKSGSRDVILIALFIFASYGVDFRAIVKCALLIKVAFLFACTLGSLVHVIPNYIFPEPRGNRQSLGYVTYNYAPREWFYVVIYYLYLKKGNFKTLEIIIIELISLFYAKTTLSRATFYLVTLMMIVVILNKVTFNKLFKFKVINIVTFSYVISALLTTITLRLYFDNPTRYKLLNVFTTGRLEYSISAILKYGITWFGQKIEWIGLSYYQFTGSSYNYVDNSYLQMLINYGIVYTIIVILVLTWISWYSLKSKHYNLTILIFFIALRAIVEPQLWSIQYNIFILLATSALLYNYRKSSRKFSASLKK